MERDVPPQPQTQKSSKVVQTPFLMQSVLSNGIAGGFVVDLGPCTVRVFVRKTYAHVQV